MKARETRSDRPKTALDERRARDQTMTPLSSTDALLAAVPKLRAFAISLCRNGDQADDLVQDALLRAWSHMASFEPGTNMHAWLCTILRNVFYSECRNRRRWFEPIDDHAEQMASRPTQMSRVEHGDLCAALAQLAPQQREALISIGISGLSYEETARRFGCPEGTIKSRVNRARAELAELLAMEGPEDFETDPVMSAAAAGASRTALA
jgi:RNA polymerase sigma-70 factor, ECF subfamily